MPGHRRKTVAFIARREFEFPVSKIARFFQYQLSFRVEDDSERAGEE